MCALGHKRTYAVQRLMSALPPKADMCGATRDVRYGPIADIASLIDDFVGAGYQRRWHGEPERFCCFEVDRQLELGRHLDRQFARLFALEDADDVAGRALE